MPTTDLNDLPYPAGTDLPYVHLDMKALAEAVAELLYVEQPAAPPHRLGRRWHDTDAGLDYISDGNRWNLVRPIISVVSSVTTELGNGQAIVPTAAIPALPTKTRVVFQGVGTAGFAPTAQDVGMIISGSQTVTQPAVQRVAADAAKWTAIAHGGHMDVPANTAANWGVTADLASSIAYYRVFWTVTRYSIP